MSSKEAHFDSIRDDLEEKQQRLEAEIEGYTARRKIYETKVEDLDREYEQKKAELENTMQKRKEELDLEFANFTKAKENFDTELQVHQLHTLDFLCLQNLWGYVNVHFFKQFNTHNRWRSGAVVRASDFGPRGPWFEPRPVHISLWP